jgi:membrane protein YdbS with pleckstrin-like domain
MAMTRRSSWGSTRDSRPVARIVTILLVVWLVIGAIAAAQRHYFSGSNASCTKVSTIVVTILAGPLNYVGANPKTTCHVPQPSK